MSAGRTGTGWARIIRAKAERGKDALGVGADRTWNERGDVMHAMVPEKT